MTQSGSITIQALRFVKRNLTLLMLIGVVLFVHHQIIISCPAILFSPYGAVYGYLHNFVGYDEKNTDVNKTLLHEWSLMDARVWPKEKINSACYFFSRSSQDNRGIGIWVAGNNVLEVDLPSSLSLADRQYYSKQEELLPFEDRVSLYIDGRLIPNATKHTHIPELSAMLIPNAAPDVTIGSSYNITWYPELAFGKHNAKIVIKTLPGKVIEYEWKFTYTRW